MPGFLLEKDVLAGNRWSMIELCLGSGSALPQTEFFYFPTSDALGKACKVSVIPSLSPL
jgi:hypothetical protein